MMANPAISVVLPCFNSAGTLPACLESLAAQTWGDFEVLMVNDGSSDDTLAVLQQFAGQDSRFRVVDMPHGGVVQAMNAGLARCRAPYVARMDSDDFCLPLRLELQKHYLDTHEDIGLVGGRVRFGGDRTTGKGYALYVDWTNELVTPEEISLARFVESPFANPSIMFRKELVSRWGAFYDGAFPEDYEFVLRWLAAGVRMAKVADEVLVWNDSSTRISRTDSRYDADAFYRIKAGYLARHVLELTGIHRKVAVLGAGRLSRRRALFLKDYGVEVSCWIDVDPAKIDRSFHGRPVRSWHSLEAPGEFFLLSFVANRGARNEIASALVRKGWVQGRDFLLAA